MTRHCIFVLKMTKSQVFRQRKMSLIVEMAMSQMCGSLRRCFSQISSRKLPELKKLSSFVSTIPFRRRLFLQMAKSQNRHQRTMSSIVKNDYVPGTSTELEGTQIVEQFVLSY